LIRAKSGITGQFNGNCTQVLQAPGLHDTRFISQPAEDNHGRIQCPSGAHI
jgi:hypothetical protein